MEEINILKRLEKYMLNKISFDNQTTSEKHLNANNDKFLVIQKSVKKNMSESNVEKISTIGVLDNLSQTKNKYKQIENKENLYDVDELFWIYYKIIYGDEKFQLLGNINISVEKNEKFNFVEPLRKIKNDLKIHKIRILEIEDILVNSEKIDIKTFMALSTLNKMNVMVILCKKCIYFEIINNIDIDLFHILKIDDNNKIELVIDNLKNVEIYRTSYIKFENFSTKLKSVSSYTSSDLNYMIKLFNINIDKKATKALLYEKINNFLLCG